MSVCRIESARYPKEYIDASDNNKVKVTYYGYWSKFRILAPAPEDYFT